MLEIGELKTKTGLSYGILTLDMIDTKVDYRCLFTMYSDIMHDVKRLGFGGAYLRWTDRYDEFISVAGYDKSEYCLRCGEAVRYACALRANMKFEPKYVLKADAKWIVDGIYFDKGALDSAFLAELRQDISHLDDCFARYRIAFTELDAAY